MQDQQGQFRTFLSGLPHRGYCLDCLGILYGESPATITGHLTKLRISGTTGECGNCNSMKETFSALS
jgi:hypothetical protein